jgi:ribosomal protein L28
MRKTILFLSLALFSALSVSAHPASAQSLPSTALQTSKSAEFAGRFNPLRSKLLDENARFSGSQMLAALTALVPLATSIGKQSAELTSLNNMLSLLQFKRNVPEQSARYAEQALKLNVSSKALPVDELIRTHTRLRTIYENENDFKRALPHAQSAVTLSLNDDTLTASQRLGLRESLGFLLHETGQYSIAWDTNRKTLVDAERLFGADAEELGTLLINMAQNLHALRDLSSVAPYLERALKIARKHNNTKREFNLNFQLGVLAYEDSNDVLAKRFFDECMKVADRADDDELRKSARNYLKDLKEKKHPRKQ